MSIEDLRRDLKTNIAEAGKLGGGSVVAHLRDTLWPFIEALFDEVAEMDGVVGEMVSQQEDYLQSDTATTFVALVQLGRQAVEQLRKRANGEEGIEKLCSAYDTLAEQTMIMLDQIAIIPADEDGELDPADEDEEGDEDEDEDEEGDEEEIQ